MPLLRFARITLGLRPLAALSLATVPLLAGCAPSGVGAPPPPDPPALPALEFCGREPPPPTAPHPDLHCIDLLPTPSFHGASGTAEMGRAPSPFGVAVTRDGVHLWDLTVSVEGLGDPAGAGGRAYVAWVTTPQLSPLVKLGEVAEGRAASGRVAFNKFLVLVTAEPSAAAETRQGRLVLRGGSPGTRMMPHDEPFLFVPPGRSHDHGTPGAHQVSGGWVMPPMHPDVPMPPGMGHLRPSVRPFLPTSEPGEEIPRALPNRLLRLAHGDTLELVAGKVLRAVHGHDYVAYGFNRQLPGPLIRVDEDAVITVRFTNRTDFPTAVHWHGVRLDNRFDGVPGVTQDPVPPGATFTYRVRLPDPGIYWYHPHHREDAQQDLGLYGNLRVDALDPAYLNPVDREELLVLDDLLVGEHGPVPFGLEAPTHALMGRFGNVPLINGEPSYRLRVARGEVVRFLVTNVSNTRIFNLSFGGAPIKLVGSDLSRFEREEWVESVVIAPAERYVIEVSFREAGEVPVENRVQGIDHLYGSFFPEVWRLGTVRVAGNAAPEVVTGSGGLREHPEVAAEVDRLRPHFDRPPDRELVLSMEMGDLPFPLLPLMRLDSAYFNPVEWAGTMPMMNWAVTGNEVEWIIRDPASGKENMEIDWRFRQGEVVKVRLRNEREVLHAMQHPIHVHGQRFLVLSLNGVPNRNLVWKDTFILPVGWTADLLVELSNPGDWMLHCHISEHLGSGMKMVFRVEPEEGEWEGWKGYQPGTAAAVSHD
ncbi:MAG: multicopper oxidase family protein [Longimicrobiaceae bacterium]